MIVRTLLAGALTLATLSGAALAARGHHDHQAAPLNSSGSTASDDFCGRNENLNLGSMECEPLNMHKKFFHTIHATRHPRSWNDIFENRS